MPPKVQRVAHGGKVETPAVGTMVDERAEMNETEAAYADFLDEELDAGRIRWWRYGSVKVMLAGRTFYTPDFAVQRADGVLELHEVKGFWEDDARIKVKMLAEMFPFRVVAIVMKKIPKKDGGGWKMAVEDLTKQEIPSAPGAAGPE